MPLVIGKLLAKIRDLGAQSAPGHAPPRRTIAPKIGMSSLPVDHRGSNGNLQTVPLIIQIYPIYRVLWV